MVSAALVILAAGVVAVAEGPPRSDPRAAARGSPEQKVMEPYYDNTVVCGAVVTGQDLCHTWMYRDGTFINFDPGGVRKGRFTVGPMRKDGKVPVCYYWNSAVTPRPVGWPGPPQTPGQPVTVCKTTAFRTTCVQTAAKSLPAEVAKEDFFASMGRRWHAGMCYPMQARKVTEVWDETDDPLPAQKGLDRVYLVRGHR